MEAKAVEAELGEVPLQVIGIGATKLCRPSLENLEGIVLAGLAGALDPTLAIGDVVIDSDIGVASTPSVRRGKIYASDHLISTAAEKQRLFQESGCLAVDMESRIVREMAKSMRLPLLHVRAISDASVDNVSPRVLNWIDDVGRPRTAELLAGLALHPRQIPAMIRLNRNSRLALRRLAQFIGAIYKAGGWPSAGIAPGRPDS